MFRITRLLSHYDWFNINLDVYRNCFIYDKNKVIKPMYLTGPYKQKFLLPKYLSLFLQGFQEGGVVTTFGLYFGDRITHTKYFLFFHLFISYIILNMTQKQNISNIASKDKLTISVLYLQCPV